MNCPSCGCTNLPGQETCSNCQQDLTKWDLPYPRDRVERSLMEELVGVLPNHAPATIRSDTPLAIAIARMLEGNVGALLVVDAAGVLLGIFSERDLLEKGRRHSRAVHGTACEPFHDRPSRNRRAPPTR